MQLQHSLPPLPFFNHNHNPSNRTINPDKRPRDSSKRTEVNGLRNQLILIICSRKEGKEPMMPMEDLASEICQVCN